ncbi:unnamed protein product [marine sediment metagenome]|uniref:Uncharacterized protein n=1 Tax=marine sediment metagenome TaxID=412755 RepID=X1F1M6_9ZZZZ
MNSNTNTVDVIFQTGLVFLVSGIMVGLISGEWTVPLVVGVIFTISPIIGKRIQLLKEDMTQDEAISRTKKVELISRQQLSGQFTT